MEPYKKETNKYINEKSKERLVCYNSKESNNKRIAFDNCNSVKLNENSNLSKVIDDYFCFDENDIELNQIKKLLIEHDLNSKKQLNKIEINFDDLLLFIQKHDFAKSSFPYLKNSIMPYLETIFHKFNDEKATFYFIMKILSNIQFFKDQIFGFYSLIIKNNYFGISENMSKNFTKDVFESKEYLNFVSKLSEWYCKIEIIIFLTSIVHKIFHIVLFFDEKKYSLDQNFDFSIKTFAKKNFLKLASYIFKKASFNISFSAINYNRLFLLLISSFTCGISLREFVFVDIKQLVFLGGFVLNYIMSNLSDKLDNYSNFVEFARMEGKHKI